MDKDIKTLILPDIHGRNFWKNPVKETLENTDAKIIFLGDYLDVYLDEFEDEYNFSLDSWSRKDVENSQKVKDNAVSNFKEIIELKKKYPNRITLIMGNHDCGYAISKHICDCRTDRKNSKEIKQIFKNNWDLFQLADEITINNKHFIFSHAGINEKYAKDCFPNVTEDNVVSLFNDAWHEQLYGILLSLGYYSKYRGFGGGDFGSIIWADLREWMNEDNKPYGYTVIGHTKLEKPYIVDNMAAIDTADAYYIDSEGNINLYN